MSAQDGGNAFPVNVFRLAGGQMTGPYAEGGMSLRDYFAAQALTGWLADGAMQRAISQMGGNKAVALDSIAAGCYEMADAILKARER